MDALADFEDGSLDFVYIDGDHSFKYIAEDLVEWSKKVRSGGCVSGHDYLMTPPGTRNMVCHVQAVVDAYIKTFGIESFYIVNERRHFYNQKLHSWLWIKP